MSTFIKILQFAFTFLACTYISIVSAQTADFPTCAVPCARAAAVLAKCSFSDTTCLCSQEPGFSRSTLRCSQLACPNASMKRLEKALSTMCSAQSTTSASTTSSSTTTTSSTSSTSSDIPTTTTSTLSTALTTSDSSTSFSPTGTTVVVETVVVSPTGLVSSSIKLSPFSLVFNLSWTAFFTGCYILIGGLTDG